MRIFIDFDWTLFNTEMFKKETGTERVSCIDNPQICFNALSMAGDIGKFLFADTTDFLKSHAHHTLILITFGHKEYQKAKIQRSGILHLFESTIFIDDKLKGDVVKCDTKHAGEKAIFLDDDIIQLTNMRESCPHITSVRMRRKEVNFGSDITQNDFPEVSNLNEFAKLLQTF